MQFLSKSYEKFAKYFFFIFKVRNKIDKKYFDEIQSLICKLKFKNIQNVY